MNPTDQKKPIVLQENLPPEMQAAIMRIRDNFLICMVKRAGGKVTIPCTEIDAADDMLTWHTDAATREFVIETMPRQ